MITSEKVARAPLAIDELSSLFNCSSDLGTICRSPKINKWAIYKPQHSSSLISISMDERRASHMGLTMVAVNKLKEAEYNLGSTSHTPEEVISEFAEWTYNDKPRGSSSSPFRITDFLNPDAVTSNGYDHNAKPTDYDWTDIEFGYGDSSGSGIEAFVRSQNFSLRIAEQSSASIGTVTSNRLPLSYICDRSQIGGVYADWRLAIAVHMSGKWHFFISDTDLASVPDIGNLLTEDILGVMPNMNSNKWLKYLLKQDISNQTKSYVCVPCLIRSANGVNSLKRTNVDSFGNTYDSIELANSGITLYCMPSGQTTFNMIINVPIKNDSLGKIVGTYVFHFPLVNSNARFLIKGYTNNYGRTIGGWFATELPLSYSSGQGVYDKQIIIAYASVGADGRLDYSAIPPSSESVNVTLNYDYASSTLGSSGLSGSVVVNTTLSNTTKVSISNVSNSSGGYQTVEFYGFKTDVIEISCQVKSGSFN